MAAMRLLVSPIPRPARNVHLQRPQKSPGINPVFHFLLNSNPNLKHTNPVHDPGFRLPSTKARPFSATAGSESDRRPQWQTEYRRRLGIGDSLILLDDRSFRPPKDGELKINFSAQLADDHYDDVGDGDAAVCTGGIGALARNSSREVLGVAVGSMEYGRGNKLALQLYALKLAANLAMVLKHEGMHDGPVVYESSSLSMVTGIFHDRCEGEPEKVLMSAMPGDEDLAEVGRSCIVYVGKMDELKEILPPDLFEGLFDRVEKENAVADTNNEEDMAEDHYDPYMCTGGITAVALNSSGFVIARTKTSMNCWRGNNLPHWQAEYRSRLGIGDSLVVHECSDVGRPPNGEIKFMFYADLAEDRYDDDDGASDGSGGADTNNEEDMAEDHYDPSMCTGVITAVAINSSAIVIAMTKGSMKYRRGNNLELQLYALKAAANLAKELKSMGMHDGPVAAYESSYALVTALFHDGCTGDPVEALRGFKLRDEDLEEVGRSCRSRHWTNLNLCEEQ